MQHFKPAIDYLPHELPMVLVATVHEISNDSAKCEVTVTKEGILGPFINENGTIPAWFAIEMMAQTIGIWRGWHGMNKNQAPKMGLLLGTRAFKSTISEYPLGSQLFIFIQLLLQDDKLASFDCRIELQGTIVTQAKLNVYQPDDQEIAQLITQGNNT